MALVRFNVNALGYSPGDEVDDLPKEWEDRLLKAEFVERVAKKNADPAVRKSADDAEV